MLINMKIQMNFNLVVDRGVSCFLSTHDFMVLRKTCHMLYNDAEAWQERANTLPVQLKRLNAKQTIGLHYLLGWSLQLNTRLGSLDWFKQMIQWLSYKVSIRILFVFLSSQSNEYLMRALDDVNLGSSQRLYWQYYVHRSNSTRLFKRARLELDVFERRPYKKPCISYSRHLQSCVA